MTRAAVLGSPIAHSLSPHLHRAAYEGLGLHDWHYEAIECDEAGLPGFHMSLWSGLWAPRGTPKDIVAKLNAAALDALRDPATRKQLENLGLQMPPKDKLSPQALGDWQKAEIAKWWPMIKAANVKID